MKARLSVDLDLENVEYLERKQKQTGKSRNQLINDAVNLDFQKEYGLEEYVEYLSSELYRVFHHCQNPDDVIIIYRNGIKKPVEITGWQNSTDWVNMLDQKLTEIEINHFVEENVIKSEKIARIKVAKGALKQNYLSISSLKHTNLIPSDRSIIEVETEMGQRFTTKVYWKECRLRERGKIREFYILAKIKPGDCVIWKEIITGKKYYLSRAE